MHFWLHLLIFYLRFCFYIIIMVYILYIDLCKWSHKIIIWGRVESNRFYSCRFYWDMTPGFQNKPLVRDPLNLYNRALVQAVRRLQWPAHTSINVGIATLYGSTVTLYLETKRRTNAPSAASRSLSSITAGMASLLLKDLVSRPPRPIWGTEEKRRWSPSSNIWITWLNCVSASGAS